MPSIPSMNSDKHKTNMTYTQQRCVSPLRDRDFEVTKTEFRKAYNTVFFASDNRLSTDGSGSNKNTDNFYYFNKLGTNEVKLLPTDYIDQISSNEHFDTEEKGEIAPLRIKSSLKDLHNIDEIIKSDRTIEEKNTILAESLVNIKSIKKEELNYSELKLLLMYQTKVSENMFSFTNQISDN
jgi:hypothetical protein